MTTMAVTASSCASASEAAFRVASFIPLLPRPGPAESETCVITAWEALGTADFYAEHPTDEYSLLTSPHSANIDLVKVEQYCGGILSQGELAAAPVGGDIAA